MQSFLGDPLVQDSLPGTANLRERPDKVVQGIERSWAIKTVVILAAITGVALFIERCGACCTVEGLILAKLSEYPV
jgi:hypothetical protein